MLTRKRLQPFQTTGDWKRDGPLLQRWIQEYWLELEQKGALTLTEASITASQGIQFPATQVNNTDANTLDDYEEGSTTPTPTSGTGAFTTVSGAVSYTKVGNRCLFTATVVITTNGTAATDVRIALPFTAAEDTGFGGWRTGGVCLNGIVSGTTLTIMQEGGLYPGANGRTLRISGAYKV